MGVLKAGLNLIDSLVHNTTWGKKHFHLENGDDVELLPSKGTSQEDHIRQHASSTFQPTSTCMMGTCTDLNLRVRGVSNLRVCDSASLPGTNSNSEGPILAFAHKFVVDLIREYKQRERGEEGDGDVTPSLSSRLNGRVRNQLSDFPVFRMEVCVTDQVSAVQPPVFSLSPSLSVTCDLTTSLGQWAVENVPASSDVIVWGHRDRHMPLARMTRTGYPHSTRTLSVLPSVTLSQFDNWLTQASLPPLNASRSEGAVRLVAISTPHNHGETLPLSIMTSQVDFSIGAGSLMGVGSNGKAFQLDGNEMDGQVAEHVLAIGVPAGRYLVQATTPGFVCGPSDGSETSFVTVWSGFITEISLSCSHV